MNETLLPPARRWLMLLVAACGAVAALLPNTGFNIAAPDIIREFGVGHDEAHLVITGFMVASTISMLAMPALVQRLGLRRFFLQAVGLLALSGILGTLSPNFPFLVATRIFQGAVAGTLIPLGMALTMRLFPTNEQGRAIGILSFAIVLAPAVAPAFSGILVDLAGWRAVPLLSLPFCLAGWLLGVRVLPNRREPETPPFDWVGLALVALLTIAWPALIMAAASAGTPYVAAWALATGAVTLAFYRHCTRNPCGLIPRRVFAEPAVMLGAVLSLAQSFGMYASTYLIPAFLHTVQGLSATKAGAALLPAGLAMAFMFPVGGFLADRFPPHRLVLAGLAIYAGGFAAIWWTASAITYGMFMAVFFCARIGQSILLTSLNQAAVRPVPPQQRAEATVLLVYTQQMGGVVGVTSIGVFTSWRSESLGGGSVALSQALSDGFGLITLTLVAALAAAAALGLAARRSLERR